MDLTTSEADYVALSTVEREVTWLKSFAESVYLVSSEVVYLNGDNHTALQMEKKDKLT